MSPEPSTRATRILAESVYPWAGAETSTITQQLFAGDRSRGERLDLLPTGFEIERRDLRQRFRIFPAWKKYQVLPLFDLATAQEKADFQYSGRHWRKPVIRETGNASRELKITFIYQPTGEERQMFGCVARRWIVRRRDERDRKFGENWTEAITDAWHFDSQQLAARFAGFSGDLVHPLFALGNLETSVRSSTIPVSVPRVSVLGQRPSLCGILSFQAARCKSTGRLHPCE